MCSIIDKAPRMQLRFAHQKGCAQFLTLDYFNKQYTVCIVWIQDVVEYDISYQVIINSADAVQEAPGYVITVSIVDHIRYSSVHVTHVCCLLNRYIY